MKQTKLEKALGLYDILLSASLIVSGICLMAACWGIYTSGDRPFSREAVAAAFAPIAVPVLLSVVLLVLSVPLHLLAGSAGKQAARPVPLSMTLHRLEKTREPAQADLETYRTLARRRKKLALSQILWCCLCAGAFLVYALDSSHFHQSQINDSMKAAMAVLLPCLAAAFAFVLVMGIKIRGIMTRQTELLKAGVKKTPQESAPAASRPLSIAKGVILVLAIGLVVYGFFAGGTADVLTKAVNICTECVGLG